MRILDRLLNQKSGKCRCACHRFEGHFHCFKPDCCPQAGIIFNRKRPATDLPNQEDAIDLIREFMELDKDGKD